MSDLPVVAPDAGQDPAGYVLAAANVREKRINGAVPDLVRLDEPFTWDARTNALIAAEANPEHALAEVALWRGVADRHTSRSGRWCDWCGSKPAVHAVWPCLDLLAAVAAARAYLTGAGG